MLCRVTVVLVLVGVRVTADSVWVVVVVLAGSLTTVVQDDKAITQAGITEIERISFFIVSFMLTKDSPPIGSADGAGSEFFQARAIGISRPVLLER